MKMYARYSRVKEVNRALLLEQLEWFDAYRTDERVSWELVKDIEGQARHWLDELGGLMGAW